jgi:16S rRNA C967 or C1407 C5-methylase (RsmB/RsmF family)
VARPDRGRQECGKTLKEPPRTARRLARDLFPDASSHDAFLAALTLQPPYSPAIVWLQERPDSLPFGIEPPYSWQPGFVDRVAADQRPGQHPLHEAGSYYCLDASSVFTACVLRAASPTQSLVLDLCASPGGKSVFAWRMFRPHFLLCNEVIGKRTAALIANLKRCRIHPAIVTSMDSGKLADVCPRSASLVIVDAPCSGQSLVARGKRSPGCFHPATINMNANRQRRILANAAQLVAPAGHLAYITCTYARKENENNLAWLLKTRPELRAVGVPDLCRFQSHLTEIPCYRLWPQDGIGAGGFAALLQNRDRGPASRLNREALRVVWRSQTSERGEIECDEPTSLDC